MTSEEIKKFNDTFNDCLNNLTPAESASLSAASREGLRRVLGLSGYTELKLPPIEIKDESLSRDNSRVDENIQ